MTKEMVFHDRRTGSDYLVKYAGILATNTILEFCKEFGAYWLLDLIASYRKKLHDVPFAVITVIRTSAGGCVVSMREDTDEPEFVRQEIGYTDLTVDVKFFVSGGVLMFPSDY